MAPFMSDSDTDMNRCVGSEEPVAERVDVCVVGAGPAGLMLASTLTRFGVNVAILDERPDQTAVGRADGVQPKTIETMRMLGIGHELLRQGVKIFDICIWRGSSDEKLKRISREVHYPSSIVDLLEPYILIGHQGMIEKAFLDDLHLRGGVVRRSHRFTSCEATNAMTDYPVLVRSDDNLTQQERIIKTNYLVGCDGAHSKVREAIFDSPRTAGSSVWGVLDGELDTDFPDIWSKTVIFSEEHGSILIIPRERNMTRFYVEMKGPNSSKDLGQEYVMRRAKDIFHPYRIDWKAVEWFGKYQVSQKVAEAFMDSTQRVIIAGDAAHSHSPKAAQGMNTSVHDTYNLAWKLNLAIRGLAKPALLQTYELERKKIGQDLIDFDYEHANQIAAGDAAALAENFQKNIRFISGVGAEYASSILNQETADIRGTAKPGCNLTPAKATRYYDANPVDLQLDIPVLGQFKIYTFVQDLTSSSARSFLTSFSDYLLDAASVVSQLSAAAEKSYHDNPRKARPEEVYTRPERYTTLSQLFTWSLITATQKSLFEISDLPALFSRSPWTVYLDSIQNCTKKWLGDLSSEEAAVLVVRPDGYVGCISRWNLMDEGSGKRAGQTLDSYFDEFLQLPS